MAIGGRFGGTGLRPLLQRCVTILYLGDVSAEVAETLRKRAAAEGKSLSFLTVWRLGTPGHRSSHHPWSGPAGAVGLAPASGCWRARGSCRRCHEAQSGTDLPGRCSGRTPCVR